MSDTPKTDAVVNEHSQMEEGGRVWYLSGCNAMTGHARVLEREIADLQARYSRLAKAARNAMRMLSLARAEIPEASRPTFREWDDALEEFEQALRIDKPSPLGEAVKAARGGDAPIEKKGYA